jgi:hypothetical protein
MSTIPVNAGAGSDKSTKALPAAEEAFEFDESKPLKLGGRT